MTELTVEERLDRAIGLMAKHAEASAGLAITLDAVVSEIILLEDRIASLEQRLTMQS